MGDWEFFAYSATFPHATAEQRAQIESLRDLVPGCRVSRDKPVLTLWVAESAAWLVDRWLDHWGIGAGWQVRVPGPLHNTTTVVSREHVKLNPHQAEGRDRLLAQRASLKVWPCGGGKTLGGATAALAAAGARPVLVVGPAKSRPAWEMQIPRFFHHEAYVVRSPKEEEDRAGELDRYLRRSRGDYPGARVWESTGDILRAPTRDLKCIPGFWGKDRVRPPRSGSHWDLADLWREMSGWDLVDAGVMGDMDSKGYTAHNWEVCAVKKSRTAKTQLKHIEHALWTALLIAERRGCERIHIPAFGTNSDGVEYHELKALVLRIAARMDRSTYTPDLVLYTPGPDRAGSKAVDADTLGGPIHGPTEVCIREPVTMRCAPIVFIGIESLPLQMDIVDRVNPAVLLIDEIHTLGQGRIIRRQIREPGGRCPACDAGPKVRCAEGCLGVSYEPRTTPTGRLLQSAAVDKITRRPGIIARIGLTGTVFDNADPDRIWHVADLLQPGTFGGFSRFKARYSGYAEDPETGYFKKGINDVPPEVIDELWQRLAFFTHHVPRSVTHAGLPPLMVEAVHLTRHDIRNASYQGVDGAVVQQWAARHRAEGSSNRAALAVARLVRASLLKHPRIIEDAIDVLKDGGKVVTMTAFREDREMLYRAALAAMEKAGLQGEVAVATGDGEETPNADVRQRQINMLARAPGASWGIFTVKAYGTSLDGMQSTNLAQVAVAPYNTTDDIQMRGRFDRKPGMIGDFVVEAAPTILRYYFARGTDDDKVISALCDKFGRLSAFFETVDVAATPTVFKGRGNMSALLDSIANKLKV